MSFEAESGWALEATLSSVDANGKRQNLLSQTVYGLDNESADGMQKEVIGLLMKYFDDLRAKKTKGKP